MLDVFHSIIVESLVLEAHSEATNLILSHSHFFSSAFPSKNLQFLSIHNSQKDAALTHLHNSLLFALSLLLLISKRRRSAPFFGRAQRKPNSIRTLFQMKYEYGQCISKRFKVSASFLHSAHRDGDRQN